MHIEPLAPRLCLSAGTDTTFGTRGRVDLATDAQVHALAATADRVDVAYASGNSVSSYLALSDRGRGIGGVAAGTAGNNIGEVDQILPLPDGRAYAIGATDTAGGTRTHFLSVTRYTADGKPDPNYFAGGTFVYDLSNTTAYDLKFDDAVLTPDGGLVVAFDRSSRLAGQYTSEVVLIKLRNNGVRDKTFGGHGSAVVMNAGYDSTRPVVNTVAGYDLTTGDDGSIRVLLSTTQGIRIASASDAHAKANDDAAGDVAVDAAVQIKSRTLTADGVEDPAQARSWTIVTPTEDTFEDTRFAPLLVAADGPTGATVIGRAREGDSVSRPDAYVLRVGHRPRVSPFATGKLTASQVVRTDTGKYFALLHTGVVARLTADFTLDPTFANAGLARPDLTRQNPLTPLHLYAAGGDRAILPLTLTVAVDDELFLLRLA